LTEGYASGWEARKLVGDLQLNTPLLITFMALFGVIVGPVNLFVLAKGGRRARLFWTTPLISVGASALLLAVIVMQDGFGGSGARFVLVYLLPAERKAIVQQEQVSRTGMVLNPAFKISDPVFLAPIKLQSSNRISSREFEQSPQQQYGGGWFASRSVQAQFAETIMPTRAEVQLLNGSEVRANSAAPIIVSSIGATLRTLIYVDETGKRWEARDVHVGQKITLNELQERGSVTNLIPWKGGPLFAQSLAATISNRNFFWAVTDDVTGIAINTLSSIRWTHQQAVYLGPVTSI
jgi:hypothetical protein